MKSILVVDDNKMNLAAARTVLSNEYRVIPVMKGQQALAYLEENDCDIVLLDINMPEMDGFEVLERIRGIERCRDIPVIFLTADNDAETETRGFKAGAADFLTKPFIPEVMLSRIGRVLELEDLRRSLADRLEQKIQEVSEIRRESQKDTLTGLWDRAYTENTVNELLERRAHDGALLYMDIDNFKSVNDNYGHSTGDELLKSLADILRKVSREDDILCRIGGDEFMVYISNTASKAEIRSRAMSIITEFSKLIEDLKFDGNVSLSVGIAQSPDDGTEFAKLYSCADKALYYVKRNGKNSCHFFSDRYRGEGDFSEELVDLKYLQELMRRGDSGNGAYYLDVESFRHVYNFIRRFEDRHGGDVSVLLFTLSGSEDGKPMEILEETICTHLRRSDVAARYSNKQTVVVLLDASRENSSIAAERIVQNFNAIFAGSDVRLDYDIASLDSKILKGVPKDQKEE